MPHVMPHARNLAIAVGVLALSSALVIAQETNASKAQMRKEAKISMDSARVVALAEMRHGNSRYVYAKSGELTRENGRLVYSFDVVTRGKPGVDEVNVDAVTGAVFGAVEHGDGKKKP